MLKQCTAGGCLHLSTTMDITQRIYTIAINFAVCCQCCLFLVSDMEADTFLKLTFFFFFSRPTLPTKCHWSSQCVLKDL